MKTDLLYSRLLVLLLLTNPQSFWSGVELPGKPHCFEWDRWQGMLCKACNTLQQRLCLLARGLLSLQ